MRLPAAGLKETIEGRIAGNHPQGNIEIPI
jgi:hypothetical protein